MNVCRVCGHRDHGSGIDYDAGGNKYVDPCECDEGGCSCEGDPGWYGGAYITLGMPIPFQSMIALYVEFEGWLLRFQSLTGSEDQAWDWMEKAATDYMESYYADAAGPVTLDEFRQRRARQLVVLPMPQ